MVQLIVMSSQMEKLLNLIKKRNGKEKGRGRKNKEKKRTKANLRNKRQRPFFEFLYLIYKPIQSFSTTF